MQTPSYMDGRSIVPLLVSTAVAEQQGERLPGSVLQTLARHEGDDVPMSRVASFHTYLLRPICDYLMVKQGGRPILSAHLNFKLQRLYPKRKQPEF